MKATTEGNHDALCTSSRYTYILRAELY